MTLAHASHDPPFHDDRYTFIRKGSKCSLFAFLRENVEHDDDSAYRGSKLEGLDVISCKQEVMHVAVNAVTICLYKVDILASEPLNDVHLAMFSNLTSIIEDELGSTLVVEYRVTYRQRRL